MSFPASAPPPSTLFFLRHGARLDQLEPEWHLSSPTPYDPPLTTRGVAQARQTGIAINDALPKSKRRIILHTSPFLRCVQTALALAAAIEDKVLLRIDAWLGEWLTPDYYMDIDPPPPGRQLCSTALAALAGRTDGVVVDWTWNSLKLGDGGEYGEEWVSMHARFNAGLQRLLRFYENDATVINGDGAGDVQTVVIMVTHGAGCNALLGALTHKPVLTDIPISSLSMAVLRPITPSSLPQQVEYDLLLQTSTAHLLASPAIPSTYPSSTHSRESTSSLSPIIPDKRVLEYHPVRSRSVSSFPSTNSDPLQQSSYQSRVPSHLGRHPSLTLQTGSSLFTSSPVESTRTGLWTPSSPSAAPSDEDDELEIGKGARRKRVVGLWRSWAEQQ